ncbi:MAG: di-trans,poly-cis-decaprenylcistransferase, partial [Paramuribaculum sp.]|nr:di-trans,poly-cis-decaprenylcistransferase [Paramuribaculum sp.]
MTDKLRQLISQIECNRVPRHVAVIMDGNGRWAKSKQMERTAGHTEGVNTVRSITEIASDLGVGWLTLYAFSTENWNRPKAEVDALMHLIVVAIERETPELIRNNVRLTMIGDFDRMPPEALSRLRRCIDETSACTGLTLILALSYSARWEITEACRRIAAEAAAGRIDPADISDMTISDNLSTAGIPDPDLLIRTGGDLRVSNFLLWQIAYAEFYVTPTYWPDFTKAD